MSNMKSSNLIAFSQSIEKFLKQDFHNIKESHSNNENNLEDINEQLLDNENNIPVIEIILSSIENEEAPETESQSDEETPLSPSSTLIDFSRNIDEEPVRESIFKKTKDKLYGDDLKMEKNFDEKIDYNWNDNDEKNMRIYGCKCYKDSNWWHDNGKDMSLPESNHDYSEPSWSNKPQSHEYPDDFSESMWDKYDDTPKKDNNKDKDKDKVTMLAEGKGTIANTNTKYETSPEISFKFFISKKSDKYVGYICLVNYDEEILLMSDDIEYFNSTNHNKFVAIFHVEEEENETREITVYGTTQVYNILPTLFVFSAPHCGETDTMSMGGSVTSGKIKIAKKNDK